MSAASLNLTNVPHEAARTHRASNASSDRSRPVASGHASRVSSTTGPCTDVAGRIDPSGWDQWEATDPALDRSRFDHEFGAPLENVPAIGAVS